MDQDIIEAREGDMRKLRGRDVSMIFQEPMTALNPVLSVRNQILDVIKRHHPAISDSEAASQALDLLKSIHIPDPERIMKAYPHELSGGLRQRVLIAMAFSSNPKLIIADEPTTALDVTIQAQILSLLREKASETNTSVVFISHDLAVVAQLCDRVYVMYQGEIVEQGKTEDVIRKPRHAYTRALLNAIPEGKPHKSRLETVAVALDDTATAPSAAAPDSKRARSDRLLLQLSDLSVRYPIKFDFMGRPTRFHTAVDSIDLKIFEGETLSIVGESGSGKTTVAKAIVGLTPPAAGQIVFEGKELTRRRSLESRRAIQMVFQDPQSSLNPRQKIWQIVTEPLSVSERLPKTTLKEKAAGFARDGGTREWTNRSLCSRILGRPAPAHRHRPSPCDPTQTARPRRADLGPRRLRSGANPESAPGSSARSESHLSVHLSRCRRRSPYQ